LCALDLTRSRRLKGPFISCLMRGTVPLPFAGDFDDAANTEPIARNR
jgi:hypothetical protein